MCSYEKPGWPGYRDLGKRDENFPYEHSSPGNPKRNYLDKMASLWQQSGPKWHNFYVVCIFTLGVCELALLVKLQGVYKATTTVNDSSLLSTILVVFLGFYPGLPG